MPSMSLSDEVLMQALALGFDLAGIVPVRPPRYGAAFTDWLAAGYDGEMAYLAVRASERLDPVAWLPDARSLILLAANYNPGIPPPEWQVFRQLTVPELADVLIDLARKVPLARFRKHPRGPKKPRPPRQFDPKHPHQATAKLLATRRT